MIFFETTLPLIRQCEQFAGPDGAGEMTYLLVLYLLVPARKPVLDESSTPARHHSKSKVLFAKKLVPETL
jgi:hypothetical protein